MTLPKSVIDKDHTLSKSADELMKLRWHWTLDPSNAKAVSFSEYARQVGSGEKTIRQNANGWASYLQAKARGGPVGPGAAQTPSDFRELAKMGEDRRTATTAVAAATGRTPSAVAKGSRDEVEAVLVTAQERVSRKAEKGKPTTLESEIEQVATDRVRARKTATHTKNERKARHTARYIEIEGNVAAAMQKLRKVLANAEDVDFADEERELISESLGKLRALLGLIELRVSGETDIDWDSEFQKITAGKE